MTKIHEALELGQSIWCDYISKELISGGGLQRMINQGVRGVTSNPAIFEKAIAGSNDYDADLKLLCERGASESDIYEAITLKDVQMAADIMRPVYEESSGVDGYVSLEVNPLLAGDTKATISEAGRLFGLLGRPNVMIKIPATPEGIPAIEACIAEGININATLIFSLSHYEAVAGAYVSGLRKRLGEGRSIAGIASVASLFVSRVDTAVDRILEERSSDFPRGRVAVDNARGVYEAFLRIFGDDVWKDLASKGASVQRPLWASTSAKNPAYPDTLYVDSLIGPDTVNTVPPATLEAFLDHGTVGRCVDEDLSGSSRRLVELAREGVNLDAVTAELQRDGVNQFIGAFQSLMTSITEKRERLLLED